MDRATHPHTDRHEILIVKPLDATKAECWADFDFGTCSSAALDVFSTLEMTYAPRATTPNTIIFYAMLRVGGIQLGMVPVTAGAALFLQAVATSVPAEQIATVMATES